MNKLIAAIKKIRPRQILTTFLAGILLFVSTSCSLVQAKNPEPGVVTGRRQEVPSGGVAVPGQKNPRYEVPGGTATTPDKDVTNTFQGGPTMNEFSDVDPRAEGLEKAATQKAQALKENAERNVIDQTSNVGENTKRILDKKGENAEDFGKNLKSNAEGAADKAQGTVENLVKGTKRGTENIKDNTLDATKGVNRSVSEAADTVKDSTKGLTQDLSKSAKGAVDDASGYTQSKAYQAIDRTQRGFNKAADTAKDAVD